jgi:hypothetical protein
MAQPKSQKLAQSELLVLDGAPAGIDKIPAGTPLTRLNYYDGLFLRAAHLDAEQRYVRALAGFANQGLGAGPVHGFSTELEASGDTLALRAGLAFDSQGRTLFLPVDVKVSVQELIDKSSAAPAAGGAVSGLLVGDFGDCTVAAVGGGTAAPVAEGSLYVVSICHLEALCGQEDVYGRLCEKACATDVERPWRVEGVLLRALPLPLTTPFPQSLQVPLSDERFLRSNVAHSFFEDERLRRPHLISAAGLHSHVWCLGAGVDACACVPLAVIARSGGKSLFLDPWIVRRERMETPARRYWDWRMAMRPWDVFLAQVLQFQCQLADGPGMTPPEGEPCENERQTLDAGVRVLDATLKQIQESSPDGLPPFVTGLTELRAKFAALLQTQAGGFATSAAHVLIDQGFGELPPAGWLPVVKNKVVQGQVRALMGAGVDLRFCIVRPDYIGHALEEAQHLERISLTKGLDDPTQLEEVDILVPNGAFVQTAPPPQPQTGAIAGRVMDPNGGSQPGTTVTAEALAGGAPLQTVTDSKSNFAFSGLTVGDYKLSATVAGLGTATQTVTVVADQTVSVDLIVGGTSVVAAPAPGAVVSGVSITAVSTLKPLQRPIVATLDWVFFHRRREKQCGGEPPAPVKTRVYQVFHLADDFRVQDIVAAFADPQRAAALAKRLKLVGPAEFKAGTDELVTPAATFLAAWQAVQPRNSVFSAVVATPGHDDDNIESARLVSVFKVIEPVSSSANAQTGRMDDVPAVLGLAADHGFMLIDTLGQVVVQTCHDVVAVEREAELGPLAEAAKAGRLSDALAASKTAKALGKVNFSGATPDTTSLNAVKANWPADYGKATKGIVVAAAGDGASATYPPQSAAIVAALGGGGTPELIASPAAMAACPAVSIVAGSVVRRNALLIYTNWDNGEHFIAAGGAPPPNSPMEFRNNVPQGDALKNYIAGLTANQPVRGVTLATPKAAPDVGANTRLQAVLDALVAAGRPLPGPARRVVEALSTHDRAQLTAAGFTPDNFEDIVFFELNAG